MIEVKAPNIFAEPINAPALFLGGSIEMDKAERWQDEFVAALADLPVIIYNPRRDNWDSSIPQEADNPQFNEQVTWELNRQAESSLIVYYFCPGTMSPITLLELGLFAGRKNVIVGCPPGFWRKGNVDIVCRAFGIQVCDSLESLISTTRRIIKKSNEIVSVLRTSE